MQPTPYPDVEAHLQDELRRVWLCVEYHIRLRWENGTLPQETAAEGQDLLQGRATAVRPAADVLAEFRDVSAGIEARLQLSAAAQKYLPLAYLERRFNLGPQQRAALTLAIFAALDPDLVGAFRYLGRDPSCRGLDGRLLAQLVYPSLLDHATLAQDLSPQSPLVRYRLLELDEGPGPLLYRRIQAAPRLVQMMDGRPVGLDPQLGAVAALSAPGGAPLFAEELLRETGMALGRPGTLLLLRGPRGCGKRTLLSAAVQRRGQRGILLDGRLLGAQPEDELRRTLAALLRELRLLDAVPVLPEADEVEGLPRVLGPLCAQHQGVVALTASGEHLPRLDLRPVIQLQVPMPSLTERAQLWQRGVPGLGPEQALELAGRYTVPGGVILGAAQAALPEAGGALSVPALQRAVQAQLHDRLTRLGRQLPTEDRFDDLVVDEHVAATLREVVDRMRNRQQVRHQWGLRGHGGVAVLFSGSPGVGKSMSAQVIARELGLLLYEIDLSCVMSKWLGDTEKNLAEIFDAAEAGHAILLFNEADSLFGKRTSDVKNANDRYANLETNYLLQRLERFSGLAVLTTNQTEAIDAAFRRRFAYDVQFSFPGEDLRAELWRRSLPRGQAEQVDPVQLARRFELSGGFIKVAAERAAFVATSQGVPLHTALLVGVIERLYLERGKLAAIGRLE